MNTIDITPTVLPAALLPQELTPAQSNAWLAMATAKNSLMATLGNMELQAQAVLLPAVSSEDHKVIDEATATYRKLHTTLIETRKAFTNAVDSGIVQPLMAFEKRVEPKANEQYILLTNKSLTLRQAEANLTAIANLKNLEVSGFKAHVQNEFTRAVHQYRQNIRKEISTHYSICLKGKTKPDMEQTIKFLSEIKAPPVAKFAAKYLSNEELAEIYNTCQLPNWNEYLLELVEELEATFANFDSDVANAFAAIKHQQDMAKMQEIEEQKKAAEDMAITTLIASSETVVIDTPKIKKTVEIIVIESEQWAKAVMAAFIINLPSLGKYIRVKSWSKLSIGQMAVCLGQLSTDTGIVYNSLTFEEVQK